MYPNPEKFSKIEVRFCTDSYIVLGIDNMSWGKNTVIKSGFKSKQVAEAWMNVYLEKYVKSHCFPQYVEGYEFEPLDTDY